MLFNKFIIIFNRSLDMGKKHFHDFAFDGCVPGTLMFAFFEHYIHENLYVLF